MQAELSGIVLDCADAQCLAQFYEALLGWPREDAAPGWAALSAPGGWTLAFQQVPGYTPPVWPWREGAQGQMLHLDFHVKRPAGSCAPRTGVRRQAGTGAVFSNLLYSVGSRRPPLLPG